MSAAKRLFDIVFSLAGLVVLSPVMLAAGMAVKLGDGGPAVFVQERVGRNFRTFRIYKFRTMRAGGAGLGVTCAGDFRVTTVGRWLRKTKIDELPQLVNVLKGEMSIVGPRPELPEFAARFASEYKEILKVRPGITDYASIAFRDEERILGGSPCPEDYYLRVVLPEKLRLAREYIGKAGVIEDVKIILATLSAL